MFKKPLDPINPEDDIKIEDFLKLIDNVNTYTDVRDQNNDQLNVDTCDTCRICLNDTRGIPIFGLTSIQQDIIKFGCIQVDVNDGLPQHICFRCQKLLASAIYFRAKAMESDNFLRQDKIEESCMENDSDENYFGANSSIMSEEPESDIQVIEEKSIWLELDSSTDEDTSSSLKEVAGSMDNEEQEIDLKDLYMVVVSADKANKDVGFYCALCNLTFKTTDDVNDHFSAHALGTCKKCEICNNILENNLYDIHLKLHKEAYRQRTAKNKVPCNICGKVVTKTYLNFHMKMHGTSKDKKDRMKKCSLCDKMLSSYYFKNHMTRVHGYSQENTNISGKTVKCPICERSYKEHIFSKHIASHSRKPKKYICDKCGKEFKYCSVFQTHVLTHGAELKFKCQFCPYRGLHLGLLRVHVRTHTKDYLYKCSTCDKTFLTKSNLSMHEKRHKAPNSFICQECNKGFHSQRNLQKHNNMIHLKIRNQRCDICGKAFGHRDGLLAHQKKVHKREKVNYIGRLPSYLKEENKVKK